MENESLAERKLRKIDVAFVSFEEIRMMCYLGLSQYRAAYDDYDENENPYQNVKDYHSLVVPSRKFPSLEAELGDVFARNFMRRMRYDLKTEIPVQEFKDAVLNQDWRT